LRFGLAAIATAVSMNSAALALDYPTRPVRLIVPVAAGGGADITGRLIARWFSERLVQQFIV